MRISDFSGCKVFVNPCLAENTVIISRDIYETMTGIVIDRPKPIAKELENPAVGGEQFMVLDKAGK